MNQEMLKVAVLFIVLAVGSFGLLGMIAAAFDLFFKGQNVPGTGVLTAVFVEALLLIIAAKELKKEL